MDVVEMPLPADVVVSNLLAAEARVSTTLAANVSVLRSISATGDMMNPVSTLDQSSISRSKEADVECTGLHYRAGKVPRSSSPCSKRPRTHQGENSMSIARTDVDNAVSRKTRCNPTKCTSAEKSRVIRQRHNQDGKRGDKRSFRAPAKAKLDIFSSKAGMGSSDSTYGGNNILGVYGLKSDIHDVTQLVDELSLSELLDGSYKCPNLYRDKGKKVADTNESIISSVKKACSVLFHHSAVVSRNIPGLDSICSKRTHPGQLSSCSNESNRDNGDNCIEELASSIKDSCIPGALASLNNSPLLQPKDILERLTLPPTNDLDALLRDAPGPAVSLQTNEMHSGRQSKKSSLPPFAWSLSHGGQSKVNSDSGKLFTNRNMFPTRWVRLDSYCSLHGNATSCFSDLVTSDSHTGGPSQEQKINGKVETQLPVTCSYLDLDKNFPKRGSNVMSSYNSLESGGCLGSTDSHPGFRFKECIFLETQEVEGSMKNHGNEAISMDPPIRSLDQEDANNCTEIKQQIERTVHTGSDSIICYSPSTCTVSGTNQCLWHSPSKGISKEGMLSPRLLAAAQILCELANHSDLTGKQEEKLRWPKKPSQKPMKARKLRSSLGKVEDLSVTLEPLLPKPGHAVKSMGQIPSQRRKFSAEKNKNHTNMKDIIHQGSVKWAVPSASRYPGSSERDITSSSKQGSVDPLKLVGLMASPPKMEKACSSQQKPRKTLVIAPVVNNHGKDGSRGRGYKE
eukprot:TRINITY_DN9646_c0_g1_i4.p1 TRINITY_DN9646_c0_g1~~TRINITY_DN9646_c0_g1_i4.p1  ORF type:complete len:738 (-),score=146.17 TRINITY_DN9646_c0_g1_i4:588-2801(-)